MVSHFPRGITTQMTSKNEFSIPTDLNSGPELPDPPLFFPAHIIATCSLNTLRTAIVLPTPQPICKSINHAQTDNHLWPSGPTATRDRQPTQPLPHYRKLRLHQAQSQLRRPHRGRACSNLPSQRYNSMQRNEVGRRPDLLRHRQPQRRILPYCGRACGLQNRPF